MSSKSSPSDAYTPYNAQLLRLMAWDVVPMKWIVRRLSHGEVQPIGAIREPAKIGSSTA